MWRMHFQNAYANESDIGLRAGSITEAKKLASSSSILFMMIKHPYVDYMLHIWDLSAITFTAGVAASFLANIGASAKI